MSSLPFRKKIYAAAPYTTMFYGPGRKEFNPQKEMPSFESYLKETAEGTLLQVKDAHAIDEGVIGSFMAPRFLNQGHIPAFLPFMVPELHHKPCFGVEGACGTGGRAIGTAIRSLLADRAEAVFVAGFEVQNKVKSVYGADILAGAGYWNKERKKGQAFFFPGVFSERAGAYRQKFGDEYTRSSLAKWYEQAIVKARKNQKAQEFSNSAQDLYQLGLTPPDKSKFLPELNLFDCSKVSDGASSIIIATEEGLKKLGIDIKDAVEIVGIGEAEADITQDPISLTKMTTIEAASKKALEMAKKKIEDISLIEVHDCFTISGLLSVEALGLAEEGKAGNLFQEGRLEHVNMSGGLIGFGHPTGATGVRQLVDLTLQLTQKAENQAQLKNPYGLMVSMGGNDKTVTTVIVSKS